MKNYIVVNVCIVIFCLFLSTGSFCMEFNVEAYRKACRNIDKKCKKNFSHFVKQVTNENALDQINQVELYLKKYEHNLVKEKEAAFYAMKIKYEISDDCWKTCRYIVDSVYKYTLDAMWRPMDSTIHDPHMPQWFAFMLKKELIEVGINPQRINLCKSEEKGSGHAVGVHNHWSYDTETGDLDIEITASGEITVDYEQLDALELYKEEGRCMHLAQKLKTDESMEILLVMKTLSNVKIKKSDYATIEDLHYVQSSFAAALKNQRGAHCIRRFHKTTFSSIFSGKHYKQLSKIEYCWKMLDWLKKYSGNNYHCIPLLLTVKNSDVEHALLCLDEGMVVTRNIVDEVGKTKEDSLLKKRMQMTYDDQKCCVCYEHPEDMRDIPCTGNHVKDFICRGCYKKLNENSTEQKICPICRASCFSYDKVAIL